MLLRFLLGEEPPMTDKPAGPAAAEAVVTSLDSDQLTAFDRDHLVVYLRVLDAVADGVDWTVMSYGRKLVTAGIGKAAYRGGA